MKTLREFISFTNLKGNRVKLSILLIVPAIFYAISLSFLNTMIYMGSSILYYIMLYVFVIFTSFLYMIILFEFIQKKRGTDTKLYLKSYIFPYVLLQSLFFVIMMGSALLSMTFLQSIPYLYYIMAPICVLLALAYIPVQTLSFFFLYDGEKNPFKILYKAMKKMLKHYQFCFYSLLALAMIAIFYYFLMNSFFGVIREFVPVLIVHDIMISSNPFCDAAIYLIFVFENINMWLPCVISVLYGIIMCIALVYYYMGMICAYDEDIKI